MPGLLERARGMHRPRAASFAVDDGGVSVEERSELLEEIDRLFASRKVIDDGTMVAKARRRSGAGLPIAVNIAAVVVLAGGIIASLYLFTPSTAQGVAQDGGYRTAEGLIVQQVRRQATQALSARQRQIAGIQAELDRLKGSRESSNPKLAAASDARRTQLEAELAQLRSEADSRLAQARSEADARLASFAAARRQESFLIDQLQAIYQNVGSRLSSNDFAGAVSGVSAADRLLADARAAEGAAGDIARIAPALLAGDEVLRAAIRYDQAALASAGSAQPLTGKVAEIDRLVRQADAKYASGDVQGAAALYGEAVTSLSSVAHAYDRLEAIRKGPRDKELGQLGARIRDLERTVSELQARVIEQDRTLAQYRDRFDSQAATIGDQARLIERQKLAMKRSSDQLAAVIRSVQNGIASLDTSVAAASASGRAATTSEMVDLLRTKITLREAVDSKAVRQRYPELYDKLDPFFREYGEVYRRQGSDAALAGISSALKAVITSLDVALPGAPTAFQGESTDSYGPPARDEAVAAYLARLNGILGGLLPPEN